MPFAALKDWQAQADASGVRLSDVLLDEEQNEYGRTEEQVKEALRQRWAIMQEAVKEGLSRQDKVPSGMVGGDAYRLEQKRLAGHSLSPFLAMAMSRAIAVSEMNARFGRIVAAPTAGSAGVIPGLFSALLETRELGEDTLLHGLITAGGIGQIIARRATLAGSAGGCQAENGVAGAMAAGGLVEMLGGSPAQAMHATAIALKNSLGLVCDPVGGRVEVPCVKRNAGAVANGLAAAEMALAGIESAIPVDEVVDAMAWIGQNMPVELRETALGGLAQTPTGLRLTERLEQGK